MPFRPNTPTDDIIVAVTNPSHPRFGQFGSLEFHDWTEYGVYGVRFTDGFEEIPDGLLRGETRYVTPLLRPVEIVDQAHPKRGQYARCARRIWQGDYFGLWIEFENGVQERIEEEQIRRVEAAEMPNLVQSFPWLGKPSGGEEPTLVR